MYRHEKYGSSTGGLASTHRLQQIANVMLMVSGVRSDGIISVRAGIEELPNYFDLLAHVCYDIRLIVEIQHFIAYSLTAGAEDAHTRLQRFSSSYSGWSYKVGRGLMCA